MTTQNPETVPRTTLARIEPPRAAMAHASDFGPEHMRIVREAFASGASQAEFEVMWAGAKARGLDPVKKQIFFVKRYDSLKGCEVWSSQTSIDGFRALAEDTGKYDGQDEPEYEYTPDGLVAIARVRVWKRGVARPFVGVARWNEYVQTKKGGAPTHMWEKMAHTMLSKCAEALGLRKAFPEKLSGLYTGEEMGQAENESPPADWRPEPKAPAALPPAVVSARDMLDRIGRAESPEPLFAIIKQARTWPKVRGNAWLRLLAIADSEERVEEAATLFEADDLPPEILAKLVATAQERAESFVPDATRAA